LGANELTIFSGVIAPTGLTITLKFNPLLYLGI
jgi:hypothetical protein